MCAPKAPSPTLTAQAQTASNRETAITQAGLNAINQVTPYGNLTYSQNGTWSDGTPRFTATQSLSPAGKQLYDTGIKTSQNLANLAQEQSGRLSGLLNNSLDFGNLPAAGRVQSGPSLQTSLGVNDFSSDRQRVEDAMFSRLNPQLDRQRQAMEDDLVNRGIRPGSSAYSQAVNDFNQSLNDQRTSILLNAGQEQSRLQQLAMNAGNFANTAQQQMYANQSNQFNQQNTLRQNALQEMLTQRNQPLNEILALAGQGQIQQPNFVGTPQTGVAGTDVAGITNAAYNQQLEGYKQNQGILGGLFSAGASLLPGLMSMSDRRAKKDITRIGQTDSGVPVYRFRYKVGGPWQIGYMAQDLLETHPDAVVMGPDGFYRVDYGKVA